MNRDNLEILAKMPIILPPSATDKLEELYDLIEENENRRRRMPYISQSDRVPIDEAIGKVLDSQDAVLSLWTWVRNAPDFLLWILKNVFEEWAGSPYRLKPHDLADSVVDLTRVIKSSSSPLGSLNYTICRLLKIKIIGDKPNYATFVSAYSVIERLKFDTLQDFPLDILHHGANEISDKVHEFMATLSLVQMEIYRRLAAPYEDGKISSNGDVF